MLLRVLPHGLFPCLLLVCLWIVEGLSFAQVSSLDALRVEIEKSERQIREVRVEIGNRYEKKLSELRLSYQKGADLENALAVRSEEQRVETEPNRPLESRNLVEEPFLLREAQTELLAKQTEMITQIVQAIVPKLVDVKKALTVAGKLDEAVEMRNTIQNFQDAMSPAQRLTNNALVTAEEVFQAYQSSRERAEKMYRGPRLNLRGKVVGVRPDPKEAGALTLVLYGGAEGALVDCAFSSSEYRVREERVGQNVFFVVARNSGDPSSPILRAQRGGLVELLGKCEGADGAVRFGGCTIPKR
jgi:hypothetical protein